MWLQSAGPTNVGDRLLFFPEGLDEGGCTGAGSRAERALGSSGGGFWGPLVFVGPQGSRPHGFGNAFGFSGFGGLTPVGQVPPPYRAPPQDVRASCRLCTRAYAACATRSSALPAAWRGHRTVDSA